MEKQIAQQLNKIMTEKGWSSYHLRKIDPELTQGSIEAVLQHKDKKGKGYTYKTLHKVCKAVGVTELNFNFKDVKATLVVG